SPWSCSPSQDPAPPSQDANTQQHDPHIKQESPKRNGSGLSLYQVVRELQTILATWAGHCPTCHRDIPTPIRT
ncbi:hypothetical protein AB0A71_42655, partial [Kitasatospora aureofaciens]|uniref:hypothetical protein n=1 Tax=Kitasatospora aureofaciens TaxID=1894 RepID=UPI0033C4308C